MRMQWMQVALLCGVAAAWVACHGSSSNQGEGADAGDAGQDVTELDSGPDEGTQCSPCYQTCGCTPGDTFPAPQACATYTCGASGTWGPFSCLGNGCPPEAGVDAGGPDADASLDAPGDSAADVVNDVVEDAPSD